MVHRARARTYARSTRVVTRTVRWLFASMHTYARARDASIHRCIGASVYRDRDESGRGAPCRRGYTCNFDVAIVRRPRDD